MEWCKLYATFATDPKVIRLSDRAFRRYVEGMCYAALHETDGLVPFKADRYTRELEQAGLLDEGGSIHGWLNRQPGVETLAHKREVTRNRARKYRSRNAASNAGLTPTEVEVEEKRIETSPTETGILPHRAMFGIICESFGISWEQISDEAKGPIERASKSLLDGGLDAGEFPAFVEWLRTDKTSPLVSGRRLTISSLAKWLPYWKARPLMVERDEPERTSLRHQDRAAEIMKEALREQHSG